MLAPWNNGLIYSFNLTLDGTLRPGCNALGFKNTIAYNCKAFKRMRLLLFYGNGTIEGMGKLREKWTMLWFYVYYYTIYCYFLEYSFVDHNANL